METTIVILSDPKNGSEEALDEALGFITIHDSHGYSSWT